MNIKQWAKSKPVIYGIWSLLRDHIFMRPLDWSDESKYKRNIEKAFYRSQKHRLNLENPKTFSEKMQWLRVYDNTEIKTMLSDKYKVRSWVEGRIGKRYLIPLLGVYDDFSEIEFNKLPDKFVLKTNHGCGTNIICRDKSSLNLQEAEIKIKKWMGMNFAYEFGEMQYKDIERKIIIEDYLETVDGIAPPDYKIFCFNGKPYYILYCFDRYIGEELRNSFFDLNWNNLCFSYTGENYAGNDIEKPKNLNEMIEIAERLSQGFKHVRVDLYNINGEIYFGEMTFTSLGGYFHFNPPEWDRKLGDLLELS